MANDRHSYIEFYPSDWTAGTSYMPPTVEWLYLQVCLYNWDKREPMPASQSAMRFSRSPSWEADLTMLIDAGKVVRTQGGGLFVERAMVSANKAYDLWERKSRGGRKRHAIENAEQFNEGGSTPDKTAGKSAGKSGSESLASNQNQNQNQTPLNGESPPDPPAGDLLFQVSADAMRDFRDHRVKIGAPMTNRAEAMIVTALEKIHRERGHDPTSVLNQSIMLGWRGVFPLKDEQNGKANRSGGGAGGKSQDGFDRAVNRRLGID